jgi:hypothetical protein
MCEDPHTKLNSAIDKKHGLRIPLKHSGHVKSISSEELRVFAFAPLYVLTEMGSIPKIKPSSSLFAGSSQLSKLLVLVSKRSGAAAGL